MHLRSLRSLTLVFLGAFLVATVGTGWAIYSTTLATIRQLVDRRLEAVSDEIAQRSSASPAGEIVRRVELARHQRDTGDIGFLLLDQTGRKLAGNIGPLRPLPLGFSTVRRDDRIAGLSEGRALVRHVGRGLILVTIAETEPFDDYHLARIRIYLIGFGSIIAIVGAALALFGLTIRRRIGEIRHTVDAIIDGDMRQRVPVEDASGAFADQAHAFNRMLDRIASLMEEIGNVSNNIAHDLRTPLARMRSRLVALSHDAERTSDRAHLDSAIAECDDLLAMFAGILRIAEIEGNNRRRGFARFDLGDLIDEIVEAMTPVVADQVRTLRADSHTNVPIVGDRHLIGQSIVNLVENAVHHTPPGTHIAIYRSATDGIASVTVSDDGPGIAASDHALALRRFGRLDASRHDPGHGLGLPLVEAIMRLHRGTIDLADARPGLRVILRFPVG